MHRFRLIDDTCCGRRKIAGSDHRDTWTLTGRRVRESADLCVRSVPAGDSSSHFIAGHKHCCAVIL